MENLPIVLAFALTGNKHPPMPSFGEVWWGDLSREGRMFVGHYRVPSLYPKRSNQASSPKPLSILPLPAIPVSISRALI